MKISIFKKYLSMGLSFLLVFQNHLAFANPEKEIRTNLIQPGVFEFNPTVVDLNSKLESAFQLGSQFSYWRTSDSSELKGFRQIDSLLADQPPIFSSKFRPFDQVKLRYSDIDGALILSKKMKDGSQFFHEMRGLLTSNFNVEILKIPAGFLISHSNKLYILPTNQEFSTGVQLSDLMGLAQIPLIQIHDFHSRILGMNFHNENSNPNMIFAKDKILVQTANGQETLLDLSGFDVRWGALSETIKFAIQKLELNSTELVANNDNAKFKRLKFAQQWNYCLEFLKPKSELARQSYQFFGIAAVAVAIRMVIEVAFPNSVNAYLTSKEYAGYALTALTASILLWPTIYLAADLMTKTFKGQKDVDTAVMLVKSVLVITGRVKQIFLFAINGGRNGLEKIFNSQKNNSSEIAQEQTLDKFTEKFNLKLDSFKDLFRRSLPKDYTTVLNRVNPQTARDSLSRFLADVNTFVLFQFFLGKRADIEVPNSLFTQKSQGVPYISDRVLADYGNMTSKVADAAHAVTKSVNQNSNVSTEYQDSPIDLNLTPLNLTEGAKHLFSSLYITASKGLKYQIWDNPLEEYKKLITMFMASAPILIVTTYIGRIIIGQPVADIAAALAFFYLVRPVYTQIIYMPSIDGQKIKNNIVRDKKTKLRKNYWKVSHGKGTFKWGAFY
jgi:hypothetical protein